MAFHMMHADRRHAPGQRQRLSTGRTDQQGTDQARAGRIGHRVDLPRLAAGLDQHLTDQRQHAFHVITGSQLRHHAAIDAMQVDLAE